MHGRFLDAPTGPSPAAAPRRPTLVCFSHLRWDFVTQRPQHLMMRAAADGFAVVFVEEPWSEGDDTSLQLFAVDGITVAVPHLPGALPAAQRDAVVRRLLAELLAERGPPHVFWYYTAAALAFSRDLPRAATVYDNMDELSAFRGAAPGLAALEDELIAAADLVFTGGVSLYEAKRHRHRSVHCLPSAVDVAHFGQARTPLDAPADQAAIPRPRLGFFGVVDERMDLGFVDGLAALRPDWHLVMLGPVTKIDEADLPRRANIHWLGARPYAELPRYLAGWDLAFMPFALNEATRFISPTKTPEFLAGGLPVVSTPVPDVVRAYGGDDALVAIAATPAEAATLADTLLGAPRDTWLVRVDKRLAEGSWDRTWRTMHDLIVEALPEHGQLSPAAATRRSGALTQA